MTEQEATARRDTLLAVSMHLMGGLIALGMEEGIAYDVMAQDSVAAANALLKEVSNYE